MRYIKSFENITDEPAIGDYVICSENFGADRLNAFLENNIGQCIKKNALTFTIRYDDMPYDLNSMYFNGFNHRAMRRSDIKYFSSNKDDLETILNQNKYNL